MDIIYKAARVTARLAAPAAATPAEIDGIARALDRAGRGPWIEWIAAAIEAIEGDIDLGLDYAVNAIAEIKAEAVGPVAGPDGIDAETAITVAMIAGRPDPGLRNRLASLGMIAKRARRL